MSRQACGLQLEGLSLAKRGTWEWFVNRGGITDDHAREVLGEQAWRPDPAKGDASRLVAHRTALMAHLAWKRDLMTEGQLSELLKISRLEIGRASCRARVCQYGEISGVAVSLKKKRETKE